MQGEQTACVSLFKLQGEENQPGGVGVGSQTLFFTNDGEVLLIVEFYPSLHTSPAQDFPWNSPDTWLFFQPIF